jgi:TctA family transporter
VTDGAKTVVDWAAIGATAATLAGWLPTIATALSVLWMLIRIYDWAEKRFGKKP